MTHTKFSDNFELGVRLKIRNKPIHGFHRAAVAGPVLKLIAALTLFVCLVGTAQAVRLSPGEYYDVDFSNLPILFGDGTGTYTGARITFRFDGPDSDLDGDLFSQGEAFRYFVYEDDISAGPALTDLIMQTTDFDAGGISPVWGSAENDISLWADLNGSIRLYMIAGMVNYTGVSVEVFYRGGPGDGTVYSEFIQIPTAVPIPGAFLLLSSGIGLLGWMRQRAAD